MRVVVGMVLVALMVGIGGLHAETVEVKNEADATAEIPAEQVEKDKTFDFGYDKNLWFADSENHFRMTFFGYGQFRYAFEDRDDRDNRSEFLVSRVRAGVKGHLFTEKLKYRIYLNVYSGSTSGTDLFDYFLDYSFKPGLAIRGGQWKVPLGNQWNVSAAGLQFVERANTTFLIWGRDMGLNLHGKVLGGKLGYDLGVYNGTGRNSLNTGNGHLLVGRLTYEPMGKFPSSETDFARSETPLLRISGGSSINSDLSTHARSTIRVLLEEVGTSDITGSNLYIGFMYRGWSLHAEGFAREIDPAATDVENLDSDGFHIQSGFYFDPWEIAVRYSTINPNDLVTLDQRTETGVGFNYFFKGNRHKIAADLFSVTTETAEGDLDDLRLRLQWQLMF